MLSPIVNGIAFWYSNVFWNKMICYANHVFTWVFNILVNNLTIIQKSFHSCFPFLNFLIPSYNLLQWCTLIDEHTPWNHQEHIDIAWPKHDLTNGLANWNGEQITTFINIKVKELKFWPFILDISNDFVK